MGGSNPLSGKETVEYSDWNRKFLHVCVEMCQYLGDDDVLRDTIGPCEVKHVLVESTSHRCGILLVVGCLDLPLWS
jgi:hypothetical protein